MRTCVPSAHSVPIASASAVAQSIALAALERGALRLELARDLAVQVKALGHRHQPLSDLAQEIERHRGVAAAVVIGRRFEPGPGAFQPVGLVRAVVLGGRKLAFEIGDEAAGHRLDLGRGQHALGDQPLGIELAGRRVVRDRAVHQAAG